jgi:hypothetical protein
MNFQNLVQEITEVSLDLMHQNQANSLMGINTNLVIGGQRKPERVLSTYPTAIETTYSSGNIGAEIITDISEPGE